MVERYRSLRVTKSSQTNIEAFPEGQEASNCKHESH